MVSQFFGAFIEQFNFWLWVLIGIIIFITLTKSKGWTRVYFLVVILGFLVLGKFIDNFFVSNVLALLWLLLMRIEFFVSKWVLLSFLLLLVFFGLSSPFFYVIVFVLWIIIIWHFINGTFSLLDSEAEA